MDHLNPVANHNGAMLCRDNYYAPVFDVNNPPAGGAKEPSGLIKFGRIDGKPLMRRFPRGDMNHALAQGSGFGTGPYSKSPVFTVSLIEPNFIFTSTENSTMQTFDIRLMWGDTSEPVEGIAGNPVHFSIIASP